MSYPDAPIMSSPPFSPSLRCPDCGNESPGHMRFCKQCGTRLLVTAFRSPLRQSDPLQEYPVTEGASGPFPTPFPEEEPCVACLVSIDQNGRDGDIYELGDLRTDIGRDEGDILLKGDPYLSPRHARIVWREDAYYLVDMDSVNGIFLTLRKPMDLRDGDTILIGQQVLRFELLSEQEQGRGAAYDRGVRVFGTPPVPKVARLVQYCTEGIGRDSYVLYRNETILGREGGDIVFTDDPFLSRRHAAITLDRSTRRYSLHDLGSSNGTGLRLREDHRLESGDQFRLGRHLFRFDLGGELMRESGKA